MFIKNIVFLWNCPALIMIMIIWPCHIIVHLHLPTPGSKLIKRTRCTSAFLSVNAIPSVRMAAFMSHATVRWLLCAALTAAELFIWCNSFFVVKNCIEKERGLLLHWLWCRFNLGSNWKSPPIRVQSRSRWRLGLLSTLVHGEAETERAELTKTVAKHSPKIDLNRFSG